MFCMSECLHAWEHVCAHVRVSVCVRVSPQMTEIYLANRAQCNVTYQGKVGPNQYCAGLPLGGECVSSVEHTHTHTHICGSTLRCAATLC